MCFRRYLFICWRIPSQGDASACPLPDALHPLLPLWLFLGFHPQEEWDRAGLSITSENDISFPGLPYPLDNGSLGFSEKFELVFPRGEAEQNLHLIHCLFQIHHPQNPNVIQYIKDAFYRWTTLKLLPMASTRNLGPSCITSPISSRFLMPSIENLK